MTEEVTVHKRLIPLAVIGLLLAFGLPELGLAKMIFGATPKGARIGREILWIAFAAIICCG